MPGTRTLAAMVTEVRQRADMENTQFVTDTEIQRYLQGAVEELWMLIYESAGIDHFLATDDITLTAGTSSYPVTGADAVYKIVSVQASYQGEMVEILPMGVSAIPEKYTSTGWTDPRDAGFLYNAPGTMLAAAHVLTFYPAPATDLTVTVYYLPIPRDLDDPKSQALRNFLGWDEFLICDAAAKCLEKEESDSRHLMARKQMMADQIRWHAITMNQESGGRVRNVDSERRRRIWQR